MASSTWSMLRRRLLATETQRETALGDKPRLLHTGPSLGQCSQRLMAQEPCRSPIPPAPGMQLMKLVQRI